MCGLASKKWKGFHELKGNPYDEASAFPKEFEREAVRLSETSDRTRREVAEDLGVGLSTLTRWISRNRDAAIDDPE